ncbi:MAG: protein kinase [Candidatus Schekmanbacteria bacterium]|nr:protein kinase [Candidatus Schekmanbacteria bacterium]
MTSEDLPTLGPFVAVAAIGQGGMGVVYAAVDRRTGERVALKTVRCAGRGAAGAMRREIRALAELQHPGIVHIRGHGFDGGQPWYAMDLVEGKSLSTLGRSAVTSAGRPLAAGWPRDLLTVIRRLCLPLAYLHGNGFVHCDLKPGNVIVRSDLVPVLVDFGVIATFAGKANRERLLADASSGGTLTYMAPEQIRGGLLDARADLYSLGCMIYELVAGQPPFVAASAQDVVLAHLSAAPAPLSRVCAQVPAGLDALLDRLLAKDPRQRFGYAIDVAAALEPMGAENGAFSGAPVAGLYLYRSRLVGRDEALGSLRQLLVGAGEGAARCAVLTGGGGVGKTRLAMELLVEGECCGFETFSGRCPELGCKPLEPFQSVLQHLALGLREGAMTGDARMATASRELLGIAVPALAGGRGGAEHAGLPPAQVRRHLIATIVEAISALGTTQRLLFVLDDVQWADELSLDVLAALGGGITGDVVVVACMRTDDALPPALDAMRRSADLGIELAALSPTDVGLMIADMLALREVPAVLAARLSLQGQGNPYYVAELLRSLLEIGHLRRDERGVWRVCGAALDAEELDRLPLPSSLRDLLSRRLAELGAPARSIAEVAAIAGREVSPALARRAADLSDDAFWDGSRELLRRSLMEETTQGSLRFAHDHIRERTAAALVDERRRQLHAALGASIEALPEAERAKHEQVLGWHWEQAGEVDRARAAYLGAARNVAKMFAHAEAERLYRACLALADRAPATSAAVLVRVELGARVLGVCGRFDDAVAELDGALAAARELGDEGAAAEAHHALGVLLARTGRVAEGITMIESALGFWRRVGAAAGEAARVASSLGLLGALYAEQGRHAEGEALMREGIAMHKDRGEFGAAGTVVGNLGLLCDRLGRHAEAEACYTEALRLLHDGGNVYAEAICLSNLAILHQQRGALEVARNLLASSAELHRKVGNRQYAGIACYNLGVLEAEIDPSRHALAVQLVGQALELARAVRDRRSEGIALGTLGDLALAAGEVERCRELLALALEIHREVGNQRYEAVALVSLARVARTLDGDIAAAEWHLERAESILTAAEDRHELALCLCERARCALARSEDASALAARVREIAAGLAVGPRGKLAKELADLP